MPVTKREVLAYLGETRQRAYRAAPGENATVDLVLTEVARKITENATGLVQRFGPDTFTPPQEELEP